MSSNSLCPSEDSKGLRSSESSETAEHPPSHPWEIRTLTLPGWRGNPKIKTAGATSATVSPMAGAQLQQVCYLPSLDALCVWAQLDGWAEAGGSGLSCCLSSTQARSRCLPLVSLQGDGQGQRGLPAQAGWNPSSARGVWGLHAPVVSAIRSGTMVLFKSLWVVLCSSSPLPSCFEVPTEQYRMNVLGFPDMAVFCSSSAPAPTPHKPPRPLLLTSGPVLESLAGAEPAGRPQPERRRPEGWEPPWLSLRRRRRWSSPGWHQTCKARWGCQRLLPCGEEKQKAMVGRQVLAQLHKVWMRNFVNALMLPRLCF